jgi:hypothetical protein
LKNSGLEEMMNKNEFAFILLGMCIAYCVVVGNASAETVKNPIGSLSFTHDVANGLILKVHAFHI